MDLFKRMIAFVMAYSFTEDQEESPSMIPMADMLNHHSNNNANLIYQRDCLKMISCRRIDKVSAPTLFKGYCVYCTPVTVDLTKKKCQAFLPTSFH